MDRVVELVDPSGKVVNRVIVDSNSAWNPPAGHTIRDVVDGATFGEPAPVIPIPPNLVKSDVELLVESMAAEGVIPPGKLEKILDRVKPFRVKPK
jgi:hypothetical protein